MFKLCFALLVLVAVTQATPCYRGYPSQQAPQPAQPTKVKKGTKTQILAALKQIIANQQQALNNPANPAAPAMPAAPAVPAGPSQDQQILDLLKQLSDTLNAQAAAAAPGK